MKGFHVNVDIPVLPKPDCCYPAIVNLDACISLLVWVHRLDKAVCFARFEAPTYWPQAKITEQLQAMLCLAESRFNITSTGERKWPSKI